MPSNFPLHHADTVAERNWQEMQRLLNAAAVLQTAVATLDTCPDVDAAARHLEYTRQHVVNMLAKKGGAR